MTKFLPCDPDELRPLFLFEKLTDEQLDWLCREGPRGDFEPGPVYTEGEPATCFYVLLEGTLVLSRRVGGDDVETNRTSQRGVYAGACAAYLGGPGAAGLQQRRCGPTEPSRFFVLDAEKFATMMREWFPMAVHLLEGLFFGIQNIQQVVGQRERLLALGSLSAGLTHELNNPAAAAVRATAALRDRVAGMRHKLGMIATGPYDRGDPGSPDPAAGGGRRAGGEGADADPDGGLRPRGRVGDWLEDHGIDGGWDSRRRSCRPGWTPTGSTRSRPASDPTTLEGAVRWLNYTVETELLMNEIEDSTTRISTLVGAAKQYSQMDRAPFQVVDVHELLDSTLIMLAGKIGAASRWSRTTTAALPPIPVLRRGAEPGVDEPDRQRGRAPWAATGTLTVRTARDDDWALVEIGDTGPGVPGGHPGPDLRAVLHHQAGRRGHRPRAGHLLADRGQQAPRRPAGGVGAGRHAFPGAAAARPAARRRDTADDRPGSEDR